MKKTRKRITAIILCMMFLLNTGCGENDRDLWSEAVYTENVDFGQGAKELQVEVRMEEKSVTFTIKTDETILGDILLEHEIIRGEEGPYGLYIQAVNGVEADFDRDKAYWAVYQDGEYLMSGVETTEVSDGDHYELVYTKE